MENLTTLQAVATKVNNDSVTAGDPDPNYTAYLVEGNDIGGIDVRQYEPPAIAGRSRSVESSPTRASRPPRARTSVPSR